MVDAVGSGQGVVSTQLARVQNDGPSNDVPKAAAPAASSSTDAPPPPPPPPADSGRGGQVDTSA